MFCFEFSVLLLRSSKNSPCLAGAKRDCLGRVSASPKLIGVAGNASRKHRAVGGPWEPGSHVEGAEEDTVHLPLSHSLRSQSPGRGVQPPSSGDGSASSGHGHQE